LVAGSIPATPARETKERRDFYPRRFSHLVQIFRFSQASWRQNGDMGDSRQKNKTPPEGGVFHVIVLNAFLV
jgi:hypothetical protein